MQRLNIIYSTNNISSNLDISAVKLIRYLFSKRSIDFIINNQTKFFINNDDIEFVKNLFDLEKNSNIVEDRRLVVNKIFKYDALTYKKGTYTEYTEPGWRDYPLTDVELVRIEPTKYIKILDTEEKGRVKDVFLIFMNGWLNFILTEYVNSNNLNDLKIKLLFLIYSTPNSEDLDKDMLNMLSLEDIFFMIWRQWSYVLNSQTFIKSYERYTNVKNITKKLFELLQVNDILKYNNNSINLEMITGKEDFDEFFDDLL
jgi:hypothetical protein